MSGYVRVAIAQAHGDLLTYRLRPGQAPRPGSRVAVPLGRRRATGFVVELLDAPDIAESALRDVSEVIDDEPAFSPALLELARFIADYYLCPLGEVLRAMHPGGGSPQRRVRLTAQGHLALAGLARGERQHAVLAALAAAADGLATTALARKAGKGSLGVLRDLERRGFIEITTVMPRETGEASVMAYSLAPGTPLISAPARKATLGERARGVLAEAVAPLSVAEIAEALGASEGSLRPALRKLEASGVVRASRRVIERLPDAPPALPASPGGAAERVLTPGQQAALEAARLLVDAGKFGVVLIEGVTGSGKTEVYLRALEHAIARGRTGLYLVPEIAITPLLLRTVRARFGERTAILHSALSEGERRDERARASAGGADVVVGARSAVFAPIPRLGLVIVDEEHESSYKQDSEPRYHGRDVAVVRARLEGAAVLLGSATPSLESSRNAETGRYALARMPERAGGAQPARVELVDMRAEWRATGGAALSRRLRQALDATLAAGRQAIMLLNRRGWAAFVLCRECGEPERCEHCAVSLTVHLRSRTILCHYCDFSREIPSACRRCGGSYLQNIGRGTEQLEKELAQILPGVAVARLDADVARQRGAVGATLADFEAGRTQILVGTQMVAKGHDFPGVTLVGVLQADRSLWLPDFRASERTFQLLTQVAGRAGRRQEEGVVIVQTHAPDHPAIAMAATQDYPRFYEAESQGREALGYPPFTRLIGLLVSGPDQQQARDAASRLREALREEIPEGVRVLGPAPAPLERLKERWRFQVLVKTPERGSSQAAVRRALQRLVIREPLRVDVDVDPQSLL